MATKRNADQVKETKLVVPPPSTLAQYAADDNSLAGMAQHRVLSRLKIVQGQSSPRLKEAFGEGTVILSPSEVVIANDEPFKIVPVFYFTDFITWADRKDTSSPAILARSILPNSEIAIKAKDAALREEGYGPMVGSKGKERPQYTKRHAECLNFACFIYGEHEQAGNLVALTFQRGEHFAGRSFISAILLRKLPGTRSSAPLWSQVWELQSATRNRNGNAWYGFDYRNPQDGNLFIKDDEIESMLGEHQKLKEAWDAGMLSADLSDANDEGGEGGGIDSDAADRGEKKF